jgi:hypothetical protein
VLHLKLNVAGEFGEFSSLFPDQFIRILDDEDPGLTFCQEVTGNTAKIDVGTLQYGQSREFIVKLDAPDGLSDEEMIQNCRCTLKYTPYLGTSQNSEVGVAVNFDV